MDSQTPGDPPPPELGRNRRFLRAAVVLGLAGLGTGVFALHELVLAHRGQAPHGMIWFGVAAAGAVALIMLCKMLVSVYREQEDLAIAALLRHHREDHRFNEFLEREHERERERGLEV